MSASVKYPIGMQSFSEIISRNYLYIDKTEYVYKLVSEEKYYFLSRPRRFGKSLLLSTLEAFFQGKRELFKGLAIERHEEVEWQEYPVLHLDFNAQDYTKSDDSLYEQINFYLCKWEKEYGLHEVSGNFGIRFSRVIEAAYNKTGRRVVVLIDEYDKPLLQNLSKNNEGRQKRFRDTLKGFYGVFKTYDQYIRFVFLTGVTKFGKVSVFSDLNNLRDLTLEPDYNAICGITESELLTDMREGIEALAERQKMTFAETCGKLKRNYDGYRFSEDDDAEGIYNPFSLLNVMASRRFADYWFMTGTPTMLIELLRDRDIELTELDGATRTESELLGLDPVFRDPIPLLFQSGYLTIKGTEYDMETVYRLGFPNEEVERAFLRALVPYYINTRQIDGGFRVSRFIEALDEGETDEFMMLLKALLAGVPYGNSRKRIPEERLRDVMFILCRLIGMTVHCELHTSRGRIDMVVETKRYVYVMEFKIDQSPEKALAQINDKGYADRYLADSRTVVKVGVEFSTSERNFSSWIVE